MSDHFEDAAAQELALRSADRAEALHLGDCADCRARVEGYRTLGLSLSALRAPSPPSGFAQGVLARIAARRRAERRLALWGLLLLAPAGLTVLGSLWVVGRSVGDGAALISGAAALARVCASLIPALAPLQAALGLACAAVCLPLLVAIYRLVPATPPRHPEELAS